MSFKKVGSLNSDGAPVLRRQIVANSITVTEGDSVKLASGFVALGTTGALVFGHNVGVSTANQVGVLTTGVAGAAVGSYVGAYLTGSDNQTVAKVTAVCDISKQSLYSAPLDATIGSTTGSNLSGYLTDLADKAQLDESATTTTTMQYFLWGVDPENTANAVANIYESQVFGV